MNSDKNLHIAVIGSGGAAMAAALKAAERGARSVPQRAPSIHGRNPAQSRGSVRRRL